MIFWLLIISVTLWLLPSAFSVFWVAIEWLKYRIIGYGAPELGLFFGIMLGSAILWLIRPWQAYVMLFKILSGRA